MLTQAAAVAVLQSKINEYILQMLLKYGKGIVADRGNAVTVPDQRLLSQYLDLSITKKGPTHSIDTLYKNYFSFFSVEN